MRDHTDSADVTISIDARSWEGASRAMLHCHNYRPEGYRLIAAKIVRRGAKGGNRCQLRLVLRHTNKNIRPLSLEEWAESMDLEAKLAQSVAGEYKDGE